MKKITSIFIALSCLVIQSCATNVVYKDNDRRTGEIPNHYGISIFLDRNGDIYPPSSITMNGSMFTTSGQTTATLRSYFEKKSNKPEFTNLLSLLQLPENANFDDTWTQVQKVLQSRAALSIVHDSNKGHRKIIFLIHGYNNDFSDAEHWYKMIEQDISQRMKSNSEIEPYFVRVHWDGLSQLVPVNIWTRAQWNGPLTGLSLRRILSELEGKLIEESEIIMLSHSTGALAVVNAVGDGTKALDCAGNFKHHCDKISDSSSIPFLVTKVRLGLLIPAASLDTFDYFNRNQILPKSLILGLNKQDFPTNKVFGCILLGSTCLNVRTEQSCHKLNSAFSNSAVEFSVFEFSNSSINENQTFLFWETHSVQDQMKRERWPSFLDRVINDDTLQETGNTVCSKSI